jgi:hypothetical protein
MGRMSCVDTPARNYHYSLRNNPEERSSHLLRGFSLKVRKTFLKAEMYCVALLVKYHQL